MKITLSFSAFCFVLFYLCSLTRAISQVRPNVILVMTDDQGYGDLACHGNPYVKTPVLDQLHKESIRLTNFHTDPSCSPTRAALMTGQYSARSGVWHTIGGRSLLKQDKKTMADVFGFNGYTTGIFGKWHLGDSYPFRPKDRGFQTSVVHGGGAVGASPDLWSNDYFDDTYLKDGIPQKYSGYSDQVWFNEAINFIGENKEKPFFCFISTNIPHAPLQVDTRYSEQYLDHFPTPNRLANYYGMISEFDEQMGKLLQKLELLGLAENTILIYMSDNGPCPWYGGVKINNQGFPLEGYTSGMRGGKIWGYENAHRVPCFIRWPEKGWQGGRNIPQLTAHFDLLPTLIEACKLINPIPEAFDGVSLVRLLDQRKDKWQKRHLIVQNQRVDFPVKYKEYQVLTDRWRLIKPFRKEEEDMEKVNKNIPEVQGKEPTFMESNLNELYEINKDSGQENNIAGNHPIVTRQLNKLYERWWDKVSTDFAGYNNLVVGSNNANPTTLFGHDAHPATKKNQKKVWAIEVEKTGKYKIIISRWPIASNKFIGEDKKGNIIFTPQQSVVVIGNQQKTLRVDKHFKEAVFYIDVKAGPTVLQGWFVDSKENFFNAEYVSIENVGDPDPQKLADYKCISPDRLLRP